MIRRKLFNRLLEHLPKKEFTIVTGSRQTGKTTLLKQLDEHCKNQDLPTAFLNLENKAILLELNASPLNIFKFLPQTDKRIIIFIDEIQYLDDPSNFIKLLYDEHAGQIKIIASGSSAFFIDDKFRDSLAGRKRIFNLLTCSFPEHLELRAKLDLLSELNRLVKKPDLKSSLVDYLKIEWEDYLIYGGYPAVITETDTNEKINRLRDIMESYVKRDILESGVVNEIAFHRLFRILAEQSGMLVNVNELSSTLRIKNETVSNYLAVLQKCFHIILARPFSQNLRKELTKMPKAFLLDTGMRNCLLNNFQPLALRADRGELWESYVFRKLADKYGLDAICFWRTSAGNEVDFIIPGTPEPAAVEAKYDITSVNPSKYKIFRKAYPWIRLKFAWVHPMDEEFFRRNEEL
ncbi:MAG: ATP-binding protein [Bacteroidales bacterium]|nr:ATP-binding protein [Bacteroidales bacterium]